MKTKIAMGLRVLLGLMYFVFGLNAFLHFAPLPPMPPEAGAYLGGLFSAPYFIWILKPTEIIGGALLLVGKAVPFALVILAPITLNIFLFHLFFTPGEWAMSAAMLVMQVLLMWFNKDKYRGLFV